MAGPYYGASSFLYGFPSQHADVENSVECGGSCNIWVTISTPRSKHLLQAETSLDQYDVMNCSPSICCCSLWIDLPKLSCFYAPGSFRSGKWYIVTRNCILIHFGGDAEVPFLSDDNRRP